MFGSAKILLKQDKKCAAAVLPYILGAAAVATVYSTVQQAKSEKAASEARARSEALQRRNAEFQAEKERIKAAREERIAKADILEQAGGAMGIGLTSSAPAGAASSVTAQAGANIGAINTVQGFASQASIFNQRAMEASAKASKWGAIGGISQTIFTQGGGFTRMFGGNTTKAYGTPKAPITDLSIKAV